MWKTAIYNGIELEGYEVNTTGEIRKTFGDCKCNPWQMWSHGEKAYLTFSCGRSLKPLLHKVIAETFIPNPNNFPIVNHIDGNKLNNSIENLEWVTYSENLIHAYENNLKRSNKIPTPNLEDFKQIASSCRVLSEIASHYEVSSRTIGRWFKELGLNNFTSFKKGE